MLEGLLDWHNLFDSRTATIQCKHPGRCYCLGLFDPLHLASTATELACVRSLPLTHRPGPPAVAREESAATCQSDLLRSDVFVLVIGRRMAELACVGSEGDLFRDDGSRSAQASASFGATRSALMAMLPSETLLFRASNFGL